jgi:hypothetical protein
MSRRTAALAAGAALVAAASVGTLAACGTTHHAVVVTSQAAPVGYGMAAYGQNGQCYYIDDPQEARNLIAAGLCQPGWQPYPMPLSWHEEYLNYYNSAAYLNYVPAVYQGGWANQWGPSSSWYQKNKTTIVVVQKNAVYKDPTGKQVPASAIPSSKLNFNTSTKPSLSGGQRTAPQLGGGNARSTAPAPSAPKSVGNLGGGNARSNPPAPKYTPPKVTAR